MGYGCSIAASWGIGPRCSLDPVLLWLWHRLAAAALIQPLTKETSICHKCGPKKEKKKKKNFYKLPGHKDSLLEETIVLYYMKILHVNLLRTIYRINV